MHPKVLQFPLDEKIGIDRMEERVVQELIRMSEFLKRKDIQEIVPNSMGISKDLAKFVSYLSNSSPYSELGQYIRARLVSILYQIEELFNAVSRLHLA